MTPSSILVIGGPSTGKTHYGAQLYGRLWENRANGGKLALVRMPDDIQLFTDALRRLRLGLAADHTPSESYGEVVLDMRADNQAVKVVWPDYAGEQVARIPRMQAIPTAWQKRVEEAHAWLFFIRPNLIRMDRDMIHEPIQIPTEGDTPNQEQKVQWSDQAYLVELLQKLLFTKQVSLHQPIRKPALGVVLSCWDELQTDGGRPAPTPIRLLAEKTPLVHAFITTNWHPDHFFCMGVSALSRSLSKDHPDQEFMRMTPEHFGYVVLGDGRKSSDLTWPLYQLIRRMGA